MRHAGEKAILSSFFFFPIVPSDVIPTFNLLLLFSSSLPFLPSILRDGSQRIPFHFSSSVEKTEEKSFFFSLSHCFSCLLYLIITLPLFGTGFFIDFLNHKNSSFFRLFHRPFSSRAMDRRNRAYRAAVRDIMSENPDLTESELREHIESRNL